MKLPIHNCLALIISTFVGFTSFGQESFDERVTSASNVRLTITNVGTFGNSFRGYRDGTGDQSCEYPSGSGVEHLFESGVWFGGLVNGQEVISTTAYDAPQGYAPGRSGFEFTGEIGSKLTLRSSLFDNPNYRPDAVSHEDFVAEFSDKNVLVPGTQIPIQGHTNPLNVKIIQETYNWNYSFSDFFVILNFTVINEGQSTVENPYFALWANAVVRNISITPAGSGGAAFYNKGGNGFMDSLNLAYCYDNSGDVGFTESYIGQKFLGAEDKKGFRHPLVDTMSRTGEVITDFEAHYSAWEFNNTSNPLYFLPSTDQQRYAKMKEGLNKNACWTDPTSPSCVSGLDRDIQDELNQAGNRSDLVSVGPFAEFAPGDTIKISYAFVLAGKNEDGNANSDNNLNQRKNLVGNAGWAQTAFNGEDLNFNGKLDPNEDNDDNGVITRFILPSPPDIPKTKVVADTNRIEIFWADNAEESIDPITLLKDFEGYRVYISKLGFDVKGVSNLAESLIKAAEYDLPKNGYFKETGFESIKLATPQVIDGDTFHYKYTINNIQNGWQYAVAISAFDRGNPESNLEPLESSLLSNNYRVFAGTQVNPDLKKFEPFVYPNPYYAGASWEGQTRSPEESRKLVFANLPKRCYIRIFTSAGDFIDEIYHDENYDGSDSKWFEFFGSEDDSPNVFSGGEHSWDLLSKDTQIISRGLFLFSVEDIETGNIYKGKFAVIK